ncbi:hypothetical protein [Moorena sp. SIO3B2]|nr:hypothetical protein [Moorena sp. SIO3B2]
MLSAISDQFDPTVVGYGQQLNPGYEAKHEGSPEAPLAADH